MGLIAFIANKLIGLGCFFGALIFGITGGFSGPSLVGGIFLFIALILFLAGLYFMKQE